MNSENEFYDVLLSTLQQARVLPNDVVPHHLAIVKRAMENQIAVIQSVTVKYSDAIGTGNAQKITNELLTGIRNIIAGKGTSGALKSKIVVMLGDLGAGKIADSATLDSIIKTTHAVAGGAGRYLADNSPDQLELYPAWKLERFYSRPIQRDWPTRWLAAATAAGDNDAARILRETSRMVALKSSDIWQFLGDGAGGYDDCLGNPFPPFALNSGFDVAGISRAECIDLRLIEKK